MSDLCQDRRQEARRTISMADGYVYLMCSILEALDPSSSFSSGSGAQVKKTELYGDVARRLSDLAIPKRFKPWTWRYIQSVSVGKIKPSKDLLDAMQRLGAMLDGMPTVIMDARPIIIYGDPERIKAGSLILGSSRQCANPACKIWFIPVVPNQIYHHETCAKICRRNRKRY